MGVAAREVFMALTDHDTEYISSMHGNAAFRIHNEDSETGKFFQISAPYELTYMFCSGTGEKDYINSVTLSGDNSYFTQESYAHHNHIYHNEPPHFHDYYEIMIVLSGSVTQNIEGHEYKYPAGSCCLVSRGLCHNENYDQSSSLLFIGLSTEYALELFAECDRSFFNIEKKMKKSTLYRFIMDDIKVPGKKTYLDFFPSMENEDSFKVLQELTIRTIDTVTDPKFGSAALVKGYLCEFLYHISDPVRYHSTKCDLSITNDALLFSRITHLMERENGRVSRSELENSFNYSSDYLNRIVKKHSGLCLYDYGMLFCMKHAALLLKDSDMSISDIAAELSFGNRTHFYKLFKKQYGMTPNEYRKLESS